jgi:hypothetical protein
MAKTELYASWMQGNMVVADQGPTTGARFWVYSGTGGTGAGFGISPDAPAATVDQAINLCTADKGDVIYVMPGHSETIAAASAFDADVAGISIIGLGEGDNRPHFHFTSTDSTVIVGAAGVTLKNLRFLGGVHAVVVGVVVEAAATGCVFEDCEWYYGGTTTWDFILMLDFAAGASRPIINRCKFLAEPAVAGATSAIRLVGAVENAVIKNCIFMGDYGTAAVNQTTATAQGLMFVDNTVYITNSGEPYLEVEAGTTGVIANTRGEAQGATIAANAVGAAMAHCENFVTNTKGVYALLVGAGGSPAADAD